MRSKIYQRKCPFLLPTPFSQALSSLTENAALRYGVECSERDIQRMELIVMQKLDFKLYDITTPLDFLKMVLAEHLRPSTCIHSI